MAILENVRNTAQKRLLFLPHASRQMSRPLRTISSTEVEAVVTRGEVIEDYPNDPRCLMLGFGEGRRAVHVVCSPKDEYLATITARRVHSQVEYRAMSEPILLEIQQREQAILTRDLSRQ
jgi:hypothetical protein